MFLVGKLFPMGEKIYKYAKNRLKQNTHPKYIYSHPYIHTCSSAVLYGNARFFSPFSKSTNDNKGTNRRMSEREEKKEGAAKRGT